MKKFILLLGTSLFSQTYDSIPFDWGGQFGLINDNGSILWKKDWRSNRLFFDGTWAIYPRMYGPEIENGFLTKENKIPTNLDSIKLESYFQYDQGDYLLDRLAIGLTYKLKNRFLHMHGFKRTFMGNYNQYDSEFIQPPQQTYLASYESKKENNHGGFSIGHFNTLSGLPDTIETSLYNSRITTSNIFWTNSIGKLYTTISMDYFLQRYNASHSLSQFTGTRYLTRSIYQYKMVWEVKEKKNLEIEIGYNNRNIKMDSLYAYQWNKFSVQYGSENSNISSSVVTSENEFFFNYGIKYHTQIGFLNNIFDYSINTLPIHPYYTFLNEGILYPQFITTERIANSFNLNLGETLFSLKFAQLRDEKGFLKIIMPESIKYSMNHRIIDFFLTKPIYSNTNLYLNYKIKDTKSIYSDGIGNMLSVKLKNEFKLFNDFMIVKINGEYAYLYNRDYSVNINPVEMIPQVSSQPYAQGFNPINILNTGIAIHVSRFMLAIKWYNILDILSSTGITPNNSFLLHPNFPALGRQINILIRWEFEG